MRVLKLPQVFQFSPDCFLQILRHPLDAFAVEDGLCVLVRKTLYHALHPLGETNITHNVIQSRRSPSFLIVLVIYWEVFSKQARYVQRICAFRASFEITSELKKSQQWLHYGQPTKLKSDNQLQFSIGRAITVFQNGQRNAYHV